jgi:hypothetical protein
MIAYLKSNLHILHLIFFKPVTFEKRYENISRITGLMLFAQLLPLIASLSVVFITLAGSALRVGGVEFNWHSAFTVLAKGMAVGTALGVLLGVVRGLARGAALGVAASMTGGAIGGVIGDWIFGLPFVLPLFLAAGVARDRSRDAKVEDNMLGLVVTIGAVFGLLISMGVGVIVGMVYVFAYFRIVYFMIYPVYFFRFNDNPTWAHFKKLPFFCDEVIFLPFPRLHRLLMTFVKTDYSIGMQAIDFIIKERPFQLSQAHLALFEIVRQNLSTMQEFKQIANIPTVISFLRSLPEKVKLRGFDEVVPFLQEISVMVIQYLSFTTIYSLILPDRQEFEERTFELSDGLLGQLRERLQAENARVLLCLDEYERLDRAYEQGRITDDLLNQLRHYLQHETRLAFLFAGVHRMTERRAVRWSDYLINVKTIKLSFLDHASAEKLITAPIPDWPLTYEPGVVEQIQQITHRQPYLLQAVASDLVDYLNSQQRTRATMADLAEAIQRVLVTAELYFQNTWEEDLTEPERALLLTYLRANGKIDAIANKEVLHGLVQNDIFEVINGRYVFVIDLFKRWVLKNLPV